MFSFKYKGQLAFFFFFYFIKVKVIRVANDKILTYHKSDKTDPSLGEKSC